MTGPPNERGPASGLAQIEDKGNRSVAGSNPSPDAAQRPRLVASQKAKEAAVAAGFAEAPTPAEAPDAVRAETHAQTTRLYEAWTVIRDTCPEVFNLDQPAPLAIGAHLELIELGVPFDEADLKRFFRWWCGREAYNEAVAHESHRRHLDGSLAQEITAEQREGALRQLRRHKNGAGP
jgi:hypothetical protein